MSVVEHEPVVRPRDIDWVVPAAIFVVVQISALFALGSPIQPPAISYMVAALVLSVVAGTALLLFRLLALWREGEEHPIRRLLWVEGMTYLLGFQLVALQIAAMTCGKELIPHLSRFWADPFLASADHALLGTDAWRLVPTFLVRPLDTLYPTWALVKFSALFAVLASPASQFKTRAMLTYFLIMGLLGTLGQFAFPSVGPSMFDSFHDSAHFAELNARLATNAPIAGSAVSYLTSGHIFGGGISAMPSMHVATTTWAALAISTKLPRMKPLAVGFWLLIVLGSIGLGWHYLWDGIVATGGALFFWRLTQSSPWPLKG